MGDVVLDRRPRGLCLKPFEHGDEALEIGRGQVAHRFRCTVEEIINGGAEAVGARRVQLGAQEAPVHPAFREVPPSLASSAAMFIAPGSPRENSYIESISGKLREELLNGQLFLPLGETQMLTEHWRREYNHPRPHSSLVGPPAPETLVWPDCLQADHAPAALTREPAPALSWEVDQRMGSGQERADGAQRADRRRAAARERRDAS